MPHVTLRERTCLQNMSTRYFMDSFCSAVALCCDTCMLGALYLGPEKSAIELDVPILHFRSQHMSRGPVFTSVATAVPCLEFPHNCP